MKQARRIPRALVLALAVVLATTAEVANAGNNPIPTLDGAGMLTLAGALSVGGAWWIARRRDKNE